MRPVELTLRGFRSYAEETTFGFGGRSLVGIVGPIGSGKSSILDAVCFALYGKTPRIERETKSLINQRRDSLHVALEFDVDGTRWKAVRVLRRTGAAAHTLYRLDGDEEIEVADKAREMGDRVEELLGLDFEAFRRSVLLAQNQFAGFLEATPTDRSKVLKGVFGFDRLDAMRDAVKARLDRLGGRLQALAGRRESAEADRKELEEKQAAHTAAAERSAALEALRDSIGQVDEVVRTAREASTAAGKRLEALDALAASIPDREATDGLFATATASGKKLGEASAALETATASVEQASVALAEALEAAGGREALERAAAEVARHEAAQATLAASAARAADAAAAVSAAEKGVDAAVTAAAEAEEASAAAAAEAEGAVAAEQTARAALHAAHGADRAGALRSTLVVGDPCPVCTRTVETLPDAAPESDLAPAEAAVAAAVEAVKAAGARATAAREALAKETAAASAARETLTSATEARTAAEKAKAEAQAALDDLAARLAETLGKGDPGEALAARRAAVAEAESALEKARAAEASARKAVEEARREQEEGRTALDGLRAGLSNLAGRLDADVEVGDTPDTIAEALKALRDRWIADRTSAAEEVERLGNEVEAAAAARAELLEGAGLAASDDILEVTTEAGKEATALGTAVEMLEKRLAELTSLGAEEKELVESSGLLDRLHTDLRPSGFLEFVLAERRRDLADLAGEHLETLTAARYRFSDDGEFDVVDLAAADAVRSPASLSGGETFLASLALALALAEMVSREGGRLDAFFLDEGFGSLDPEHLDLAMRGVERLVATETDRLVVLVSHVAAMREWMEDLIVLDRDPVTGVTRVVDGASR